MPNQNLAAAQKAKKDEFYTQYADIECEMSAYVSFDKNVFRGKTILLPCDDPDWSNFTKYFAENFEKLGLKKLISTSYAPAAKRLVYPGLKGFEDLETERVLKSKKFNKKENDRRGKIFILDEDTNRSGRIDLDDLKWDYLKGDGDFRSDEVKAFRDEADVIITNPPFSLFREFLAWIVAAGKDFAIIGNQNAITYKEVFPLIKENKLWLGESIHSGDRKFGVPESYELNAATCGIDERGVRFIRVKGVRWFTNLEHGRRNTPLELMTMEENMKFSNHKEIVGKGYQKYDNYDAIEVPFTDAIPKDYTGVMGVPISFLDKYCPEQFEIVGLDRYVEDNPHYGHRFTLMGKETYARVLIRAKQEKKGKTK